MGSLPGVVRAEFGVNHHGTVCVSPVSYTHLDYDDSEELAKLLVDEEEQN